MSGFRQWRALAVSAAVIQLEVEVALGLHRGQYQFGSFDEVLGLAAISAAVSAGRWWFGSQFSRSLHPAQYRLLRPYLLLF